MNCAIKSRCNRETLSFRTQGITLLGYLVPAPTWADSTTANALGSGQRTSNQASLLDDLHRSCLHRRTRRDCYCTAVFRHGILPDLATPIDLSRQEVAINQSCSSNCLRSAVVCENNHTMGLLIFRNTPLSVLIHKPGIILYT